ncbi:hypothetical protein N0V94_002619 [Neodidymelliopsis sp. IMI 364377]|nr:hypothetical protein N0V94_002619 [Neodidymelliopsis sp. IMI 364377]
MKVSTIFPASIIATSAMASSTHPNLHAVADLIARAIDPATMDPTKLSVLSVLKTAMPTATDATLPTGTAAPQWYKDLPADVMVLLAQMYPVTPTAAAEIETAAVSVSQTTLTRTLEVVPTATSNATALSTGSPADTAANGTLSTGSPSTTQSALSTGAKNAIATGKWSFAVGLGVAMCFFAFA